MTRATDYDTSAEIVEGTFVVIQSGTVNAGTLYIMTTTGTVTVGTTDLTWVSLTLSSGTVTSVTAGTGVSTGGSPITNTGTVSLDLNSLATVTALGADYFPLVDSSDSNNLKKALVSDIGDFKRVGSSGTLGAVSSYIFEDDIYPSLFDGTYSAVVFDFVDVAFATDATFLDLTVSVASAYLAGTNYLYAGTGRESGGAGTGQNSTGAALMRISNSLATGNSTNESVSGFLKVWKPNSLQWKKVIGAAVSLGTATVMGGMYNFGTVKTTSALDGFKFAPSAGNFAGGEIIVYGVK